MCSSDLRPTSPPPARIRTRPVSASSGKDGRFQKGDQHPRAGDLEQRLDELRQLDLGTLTLTGPIVRGERSRQKINAVCSACGVEKVYDVDNLRAGRTRTCACRRGVKYGHPSAVALSDRYHAAVGRCTNPRNPAYNNYGELGIEVRFSSAEDWVNYILTLEREGEIEDLDVDRIDNDGHYERGNLRLVPRAENLRNKSTNKFVIYRDRKSVV